MFHSQNIFSCQLVLYCSGIVIFRRLTVTEINIGSFRRQEINMDVDCHIEKHLVIFSEWFIVMTLLRIHRRQWTNGQNKTCRILFKFFLVFAQIWDFK